MEDKVIDIICDVLKSEELRENLETDLLEQDLIDSMAFIELISRLEDEFDIEIQPTEEGADVWKNANSIINMVKRKTYGK